MHDHRGGNPSNTMPFPFLPDMDSIKYYKQTLQVSVHHFYIITEIGEPDCYLDMINVLKTAEQHDTVFIYLNTPGGDLYTAIQIISAIRQSNATVITCIEGMVASAGTLIFLAGHKHVVNPNCTFMIHNYSHGAWGKGNEVALRVKHSEHYFKKLATDMYGKFLTVEEINDVINGKDFWMESDEVLQRLGAENSSHSVNALMETLDAGESVPAASEEEEEFTEEELEEAAARVLEELRPLGASPRKPKKSAKKKTDKKKA